MICPRCGKENYEDAPECSNCFYKFRFGHGLDDPAKGDPWFLSRAINSCSEDEVEINPTRSKIIIFGLILIAFTTVVPFILMLITKILGRT